jgi:RNA polymerase sigma-70 factor (ECF subfamily)
VRVTSVLALGADLKHPAEPADSGRVAVRRPSGTGEVAFDDVRLAALAHESWACRRLYDDYAGRVLGYLRAQGAPEPEDLTSEVFLRVFDRLPQFSGDEPNSRSWLFTIAHRILIDDARRRQRRPRTTALGLDVETRPAGDVEHEAMAKVGADWADELLASLPPDQRAVVSLRVTADLSLEQVAEILGKRVGAVKSLQHRALESLRRRCEEVPA